MPPEETASPTPATPEAAPSFNMDAAVQNIASSMGVEDEKETEAASAPGDGSSPAQPTDTAPPADKGTDPAQTDAPGAPSKEAAAVSEPPDTWTAAAKAEWAKLPPTIQNEVVKRENDVARFVHETKGKAEVGAGFEKLIEPFQNMFRQYRVNPWNHVSALLNSHAILLFGNPEQKAQVALGLLKDAGLDPAKLGADGNLAAAFQQQPNGETQALRARIAELEGGVTSVMADINATRTAEREAEVAAFAEDPAHPHFYEVWQDIATLMERKVCKTLDEAYERAVWGNPITRMKETERLATERAEKAKKANSEKLTSARKATAANVSGNGAGSGAAKALGNWEDGLADTLAEIRQRDT